MSVKQKKLHGKAAVGWGSRRTTLTCKDCSPCATLVGELKEIKRKQREAAFLKVIICKKQLSRGMPAVERGCFF